MVRRRPGAALLVVLATLALVALLALTFLRFARIEADASAAETQGVQARLAASGGVEFACARLMSDLRAGDISAPDALWRHPGGPLDDQAVVSYPDPAVDAGAASGSLGDTARFALRILDANSQIDLNLPSPGFASTLDELGRAIEVLGGVDPVRGRGGQIVALRDVRGRFDTKEDLVALLGPPDFRLLESYVTVHARVDPRAVSRGEEGVVTTPRAPVSLNTAPIPVLVAVLSGLEGPRGGRIPFEIARQVAAEIAFRRTDRGPFTTQQDLREFLTGLVAPPRSLLTQDWAWTISINADPNYRSSRLNPDQVVHTPFDRSDLRQWTTEFCFIESGVFEILSEGRVVTPGGEVRARAAARAVVRLFEVLSHSVQSDFETARLTGPDTNATTAPGAAFPGALPSPLAGHVQLLAPAPADSLAIPIEDAGAASDRLADGRLFAPWLGRLAGYSLSPDLATEGLFEFWVKLDERPLAGPIPIALLSQPLSAHAGIQHRIQIACDGRTMIVESNRLFYVADEAGSEVERASFPIPFPFEESSWISVLEEGGDFHTWHHVSVAWRDGTDQTLELDGKRGRAVSETMARPDLALEGWPPYRQDLLLVGGSDTLATGCVVHPATIDGVRLVDGSVRDRGGSPPTRYEDLTHEDVGYYQGEFDFPGKDEVEILGFWRDEWIPATRNVPTPGRIELGLAVQPKGQGAGNGRPPDLPRKAPAKTLKKHGVWIVQDSEVLAYEIRFVRDPSAHPLNVTPIVEELAVSFSRLRVEWLEYAWTIAG